MIRFPAAAALLPLAAIIAMTIGLTIHCGVVHAAVLKRFSLAVVPALFSNLAADSANRRLLLLATSGGPGTIRSLDPATGHNRSIRTGVHSFEMDGGSGLYATTDYCGTLFHWQPPDPPVSIARPGWWCGYGLFADTERQQVFFALDWSGIGMLSLNTGAARMLPNSDLCGFMVAVRRVDQTVFAECRGLGGNDRSLLAYDLTTERGSIVAASRDGSGCYLNTVVAIGNWTYYPCATGLYVSERNRTSGVILRRVAAAPQLSVMHLLHEPTLNRLVLQVDAPPDQSSTAIWSLPLDAQGRVLPGSQAVAAVSRVDCPPPPGHFNHLVRLQPSNGRASLFAPCATGIVEFTVDECVGQPSSPGCQPAQLKPEPVLFNASLSAWGGAFTSRSSGSCVVANPTTSACSCPPGFQDAPVLFSDSAGTFRLSVCSTMSLPVGSDFLGVFVLRDMDVCAYANLYTGACSCPPVTGVVIHSLRLIYGYGYWMHFCARDTALQPPMFFAGIVNRNVSQCPSPSSGSFTKAEARQSCSLGSCSPCPTPASLGLDPAAVVINSTRIGVEPDYDQCWRDTSVRSISGAFFCQAQQIPKPQSAQPAGEGSTGGEGSASPNDNAGHSEWAVSSLAIVLITVIGLLLCCTGGLLCIQYH